MKRFALSILLTLFISIPLWSQRADLSGIKICIDPGHGGHNPANDRYLVPDPGTDFWESESNFQKALLLKALLEAKGAYVILTRNTNDYPNDADEPSLATRVAFANANNVNWFHSIHSNATGLTINNSINYTLMLVREKRPGGSSSGTGNGLGVPETQQALDIANILASNIKSKMRTQRLMVYLDWTFYGGTNGGFSLGVLRGLNMPGELSEGSFHDYFPETRRLMNNSYRKMEAYAIRDAFLQYFGVPADSLSIVAGVHTGISTGKPINGTKVRLLPENIVYNGDNYNNGFYMFDGIKAGAHTIRVEAPNVTQTDAVITVQAGTTNFVDRALSGGLGVTITWSSPATGDPPFPLNSSIGLVFAQPMDQASVLTAFSLTPSTSGSFDWRDTRTLIFSPGQPLSSNTNYTLRIEATARSVDGAYLDGNGDGLGGDPFIVQFKTKQAVTAVEQSNVAIPKNFNLYQSYPNPFNPSATIEYDVPAEAFVKIAVYNTMGQEVATLVQGRQFAGHHATTFDATNFPSGVYYYKLEAGGFVQTKKMILMK